MKKYREFHNQFDDPANQASAETQEATTPAEEGGALATGPEGGE